MGDAPAAGKPPRIETARAEIAKAVSRLPRTARLNAIVFGRKVQTFRPRLFWATRAARHACIQWIAKRPIGGPTNIYDSIALALADPEVDTVFVLTDGGATAGAFTTNGDILEHIDRLNRYRRVHINAIAVGRTRRGRGLLRQLAERSGGVYVER